VGEQGKGMNINKKKEEKKLEVVSEEGLKNLAARVAEAAMAAMAAAEVIKKFDKRLKIC